VSAIRDQSAKYIHLSNYYLQEPQLRLAELLTQQSGYSKVFFSNSGTEAIEGAIKICRKWGSMRDKKNIVSFTNSFHGRTMGALSLMDRPKYRNGYEPFLENFCMAPFNSPGDLRAAVNRQTLAVVLEFIQGEGGIRPVSAAFVDELRSLQSKFDILIVADEIQSGIGRTGKFFGFQHFNIKPDIVVVAKPIGGGLPLGAILGSEKVATVLEPGLHGTTFGGNPVACAAGIGVLSEIAEKGLMQAAEKHGNALKEKFLGLQREFPSLIKEVRGYGLMLGIELDREAEPVVVAMRERGILINGTDKTVLRFLPPLIVQDEHIEQTVSALREVFRSHQS
jgi:acetylornithine aminotransferase